MWLSHFVRHLLGVPDVLKPCDDNRAESDEVRGSVRQALAKNAAAHRAFAKEAAKSSVTAKLTISELVNFMSSKDKDE
jgi:hypothetical protein